MASGMSSVIAEWSPKDDIATLFQQLGQEFQVLAKTCDNISDIINSEE